MKKSTRLYRRPVRADCPRLWLDLGGEAAADKRRRLAAACHLLRRTHRATEQHVIARRQFGALLHADEVVALLQDCASYPCCSS